MALDTDEVVVAANAFAYVAPVGTAGPTNIETALPAAWIHLGYTSEDGMTMSPDMDTNEISAHQSFYAIRHVVTGRTLDLGFSLLQWNQDTIKLAFGGGTFATTAADATAGTEAYYTYTPPSPEVIDYRALVLHWEDGAKGYRLHVPKVLVTDTSDLTLARSDAAAVDLTFSTIATDGTNPFTFITNDPAFA